MTAKREDWKSIPLPALRLSMSLDRGYTEEEQTRIKAGVVPAEMEDKWFIFFEDP